MFDKFKRIIPKISEKLKSKEKPANSEQIKEEVLPCVVYKHLSNGPEYRNASIISKLWYLRTKLDWFDDIAMSNNITADSMCEMLDEIIEELGRLAYSRKDMNDTIALLNIQHQVIGYNMQYKGELDHDEDFFDVQVDGNGSIYEQIWGLRYMFDCACVVDNNEIHADVIGWLKSLVVSVEGEDAEAIKKMLKQVKDEKRKCFFRNLGH